jgi:hypothetical protein
VPEAEIPKMQAWYAKTFGGKPASRNGTPVVDVPGGQLRFAKADAAQAPTRGRVLDRPHPNPPPQAGEGREGG